MKCRNFSFVNILLGVVLSLVSCNKISDGNYGSVKVNTPGNAKDLLNHANTYYFFARSKSNTIPEFEAAINYANASKSKAQSEKRAHLIDSFECDSLLHVADNIISQTNEAVNLTKNHVASRFPYFFEIMGYDSSFKEEDEDATNLKNKPVLNVVEKLVNSYCLDRNLLLKNLNLFCLVKVPGSNSTVKELVIQKINSGTSLYTISDHELTSILGNYNPDKLLSDSLCLTKILTHFNTDKIAIIEIVKNDEVDGIYYYGARFSFSQSGKLVENNSIYVESFLKDRTYNQILPFKSVLLLIFIAFAFVVNLIVKAISDKKEQTYKSSSRKKISVYYIPLNFTVALVFNIIIIEFGVGRYIQVMPFDSCALDIVEAWHNAIVASYFLPLIGTYVFVGRFEALNSNFRSLLDTRKAIFSLFFSSLLVFPISIGYYSILRFGFDLHLFQLIPIIVGLCINAAVFAECLIISLSFAQVEHVVKKALTLVGLFIIFLSTYLFVYKCVEIWDWNNTIEAFIYFCLLPSTILFLANTNAVNTYIFSKVYSGKRNHKSSVEFVEPLGFDSVQLQPEGDSYIFSVNGIPSKYLVVKGGVGFGKSGLFGHIIVNNNGDNNTVEKCIENGHIELYNIFFLQPDIEDNDLKELYAKNKSKVHFFPFAFGLREILPFAAFNHDAENANKTGNLIAKLLKSVPVIGDALTGKEEVEPALIPDLVEKINRYLVEKSGKITGNAKDITRLFVFDDIQEMFGENLDLFTVLLSDKSFVGNSLFIFNSAPDYSSRLKVEAIITRINTLTKFPLQGGKSGLNEFAIEYENVAAVFTETGSIPIFAAIKIQNKLKDFNASLSPKIVTDIIRQLHTTGIAERKEKNDGTGNEQPIKYRIRDYSKLQELPSYNFVGKDLLLLLDKNKDLKQIMIAAAFAAEPNGKFKIKILEKMVGSGRMELLIMLKQAEELRIVVDLLNEYDYFKFIDSTNVLALREYENDNFNQKTQLSREYFKRYVLHFTELYSPSTDSFPYMGFKELKINDRELEQLAERSYETCEENLEIAYRLNVYAAIYFSRKDVAKLNNALRFIENAENVFSMKNTDGSINPELIDLLIKKLEIQIDQGYTEQADLLFLNIKEKIGKLPAGSFPIDKEISLKLLRLVITFRIFSVTLKQQGEEFCKVLLSIPNYRQHFPEQYLRTLFYEIKLIPKNPVLKRDETRLSYLIAAFFEKYTKLIDEIKLANLTSKELLGEVYNDFAGYLIDWLLGSGLMVSENYSSQVREVCLRISPDLDCAEKLKQYITDKAEEILMNRFLLELYDSESRDLNHFDRILKELNRRFGERGIDYKGLCFTLNYLTRYLGNLKEDYVQAANLAVKFNEYCGDYLGAVIAYSYLSDYYLKTKQDSKKAFNYCAKCYAIALNLENDNQIKFAWLKINEINRDHHDEVGRLFVEFQLDLKDFEYGNSDYSKAELKHILRHFDSDLDSDFLMKFINTREISLDKVMKMPGSRFYPNFINDPRILLKDCRRLIAEIHKKVPQCGQTGTFMWELNKGEITKISWEIKIWSEKVEGSEEPEKTYNLIINCESQANIAASWYKTGIGENAVVDETHSGWVSKYQKERSGQVVNCIKGIKEHTYNLYIAYSYCDATKWARILTISPGVWAPKFPNQINKDLNPDNRDYAEKFWQKHAFIEDDFANRQPVNN
jgi:hypothetical protein